MRNYIPIYYLLCVLLIFGAFAAMAQNGYGLKLLGIVAGSFSVVFFVQLLWVLKKNGDRTQSLNILELLSLILISGILFLRVFYIRFMFVEEIFIISGLLLVIVFIIKLVKTFKSLVVRSRIIAWTIVLFHASIIFYVLSMLMAPLYPRYAEPSGMLAFAFLLGFALSAWFNKNLLIGGKKQSAFSFINKFKDHSVLLIAIFLIFTAYMGLTKINVVPKMYTDEYPQAYFELLNEIDEEVDGRKKHDEFKIQYDKFVERHGK